MLNMLSKVENENMGRSNLGWLKSVFHFSLTQYYNPQNINFGVLRVINDDLVASQTVFSDPSTSEYGDYLLLSKW